MFIRFIAVGSVSFLVSCGFLHTKASREIDRKEEVHATGKAFAESDKKFTYNQDLLHVTKTFVNVLQKEGYKITSQDLYAGKLSAASTRKDAEGNFNSGFVGGRNYKVSESTRVDVSFVPTEAGIVSNMDMKKVDTYSMGQEEAEDIKDARAYKELFAKVKLAL